MLRTSQVLGWHMQVAETQKFSGRVGVDTGCSLKLEVLKQTLSKLMGH